MNVAGIQLPGRENRRHDPYVTSLEDAAHAACDAIIADKPREVVLLGHSLGGRIAARCSQLLVAQGCEPLHLFVSAAAPTYTAPAICHLDDVEFTQAVMSRFNGVSPEIVSMRRVWDIYRPIVRADLELLETAGDFEGEIACPLTLICGSLDEYVSEAAVREWMRFAVDSPHMQTLEVDHNAVRSAGRLYLDVVTETILQNCL
jgi:medium-chain acyl-[acyl-carrier-protein] hydrolase